MSRFRDFESRTEPPASRLFRRAESEMRRHQGDEAPDARAVRAASTGQWWGRRTRGSRPNEEPGGAPLHRPVSVRSGAEEGPAAGNALSEALSRLGGEAETAMPQETRSASRRRQRIWEVDTPAPAEDPPLLLDEPVEADGQRADRGSARSRAPSRPGGQHGDTPPAGLDADEIAYARAQMARMSERGLATEPYDEPESRPHRAAERQDDRDWEEAARHASRRHAAEMDAPGPGHDAEEDEVALARAQIARMGGAAARSPGGGESGRARTRVLGFGGVAAPDDPFAQGAAEAPSRGAAFPVGWLVIVDGPGRGASFALTGGVAHVGRGADQTVCLDFGDDTISRAAHASIAFDPEDARHYLGAGAKSNLVRRNGRPVLGTEELDSGDVIRVGETTLRFVAFCDADFTWDDAGDTGEWHG